MVVRARGTRRPEEGMPSASMVVNHEGCEKREEVAAKSWRAASS